MTVVYEMFPRTPPSSGYERSAIRRFFVGVGASQAFDIAITGPGAGTTGSDGSTPTPGLPQLGDFYPGDNELVVDDRVPAESHPGFTIVSVLYKRPARAWSDVDLYRVRSMDDGPEIRSYTSIQAQSFPMLRYAKQLFVGGDGENPVFNYQPLQEGHVRFATVLTNEFFAEAWGTAQAMAVQAEVGKIHSDLSDEDNKALFLGGESERVGKTRYRIRYRWNIQGSFQALPAEQIDGDNGPITIIPTPAVDPHTVLVPIRQPPQVTGSVEEDPLYVQSLPIGFRPVGSSLDLPGIDGYGAIV